MEKEKQLKSISTRFSFVIPQPQSNLYHKHTILIHALPHLHCIIFYAIIIITSFHSRTKRDVKKVTQGFKRSFVNNSYKKRAMYGTF